MKTKKNRTRTKCRTQARRKRAHERHGSGMDGRRIR